MWGLRKRKVLEKEIRLVVARGGGWGKGKLEKVIKR